MKEKKELIRKEFTHLIDEALKHTEQQIRSFAGERFGLLFGSLIEFIFSWFAMDKAREAALKQMEHIFRCAEDCIERPVEEVVEKKFKEHLQYHLVYKRSNRKHKDFKKLEDFMKQGFKIRLVLFSTMLKGNGATYRDLLRSAFKDKEEVKQLVEAQFKVVDDALKLAEKEPQLLRVPALAREQILKIIKSAYAYEKKLLLKRIEKHFS